MGKQIATEYKRGDRVTYIGKDRGVGLRRGDVVEYDRPGFAVDTNGVWINTPDRFYFVPLKDIIPYTPPITEVWESKLLNTL